MDPHYSNLPGSGSALDRWIQNRDLAVIKTKKITKMSMCAKISLTYFHDFDRLKFFISSLVLSIKKRENDSRNKKTYADLKHLSGSPPFEAIFEEKKRHHNAQTIVIQKPGPNQEFFFSYGFGIILIA